MICARFIVLSVRKCVYVYELSDVFVCVQLTSFCLLACSFCDVTRNVEIRAGGGGGGGKLRQAVGEVYLLACGMMSKASVKGFKRINQE